MAGESERRIEAQILPSANFRTLLVTLLAALIGFAAGLIAYSLYKLIGLFTNLAFYHRVSFAFSSPADSHLGPWLIGVPVIGGLIVGLMVKYGTRKIEGHGIPEAMEAVLIYRSRIEPKVAVLKPLSAAIAIGTGGPFGAEGPIIQTGGALGSLVGQLIHTTAAERKVLLACGAGAGMAATFNTPLAGVILAIELLLFEFKSRSFIPLAVACVLATAVRFQLLGRGPMFTMGLVHYGVPRALPAYLLLGLLCGLAAVAFTKALYWTEDQFDRLPIAELWHPALGALGLGIVGFFVPRVLGVGYGVISDILNDRLVLGALVLIMVFKAVALIISLGSGTSGGLLAPMFMSSAAMGAVFAKVVNLLVPGAGLSPGAFALVAMGAVFGAAARSSFAFIIFAFEITRDYNAVLPLMLVGVVADGVALVLLRHSIMSEKLERRGLRVDQEYEADPFRRVSVGEAMDSDPPTVPASMKVTELADRIGRGDPPLLRHQGFPILDAEGRLAGIITRKDILRALREESGTGKTVLEAGKDAPVLAYPDETVADAANRMAQHDIGRLPVVSREDPGRLVGYLGRPGVMAARRRILQHEQLREPGWLRRRRRAAEGQ